MDEAYANVSDFVVGMLDFRGELVDDAAGVRMYLSAYDITTPVEIDVSRGDDGSLRVGIAPPIYRVETSVMPSFHDIRFRAELDAPDA